MDLAINYSTPAAALLEQGKIEFDRFKTMDWPDMIAAARVYRPVAVHFGLQAGNGRIKTLDWGAVARMLDDTGTPHVNLHLEATSKDFPDISLELPSPAERDKMFARMLKDVRLAVDQLGPERVIIENVPYRGRDGKVFRLAVEPATIQAIVAETGCGLLLDISHARIAAHHLSMDAGDYMQLLPVQSLRELHFTGVHNLNGRLQDHLSILENDWSWLDWVLERISQREWPRPWLLAFEYGGTGEKFAARTSPTVIATQLPILLKKVKETV
ncbi:MAG TPA: DUF692 family protein [Anaerolineales bacterium]|nr:DUF692 family protein [Anaerolineales bacterium]